MHKEAHSRMKTIPKILEGVMQVVEVGGSTLGPKGLPVICDEGRVSKDGKTVVESIGSFKDPFHDRGLDFAKKVCNEVASESGDSTTSALILFGSILSNGAKYIMAGYDAVRLVAGIDYAISKTIEFISQEVEKVDKNDPQIKALATISCNGDSAIGAQIAEIMSKIGCEGFVNIEDANAPDTSYTFAQGAQINASFNSLYFVTNKEKSICELDNPLIVLSDKNLNTYQDVSVFAERVIPHLSGNSLFIICDKCEGVFNTWLASAHLQGAFKVCAIQIPGYGNKSDLIEDIQAITGATLISTASGYDFKDFKKEWFGKAVKIICDSKITSIIVAEQNIEKTKQRADFIKKLIEINRNNLLSHQISALETRRNNITGAVCTYRVGGINQMKRAELRDRVEDAVLAAQSAVRSGILPGGGSSLVRAQRKLNELINIENHDESFKAGLKTVADALSAPLFKILSNASVSNKELIVNDIYNSSTAVGYDVHTGKILEMIKYGIIDSYMCQRKALECAGAYAGLILCSSFSLIEARDEKHKDYQSNSNRYDSIL